MATKTQNQTEKTLNYKVDVLNANAEYRAENKTVAGALKSIFNSSAFKGLKDAIISKAGYALTDKGNIVTKKVEGKMTKQMAVKDTKTFVAYILDSQNVPFRMSKTDDTRTSVFFVAQSLYAYFK